MYMISLSTRNLPRLEELLRGQGQPSALPNQFLATSHCKQRGRVSWCLHEASLIVLGRLHSVFPRVLIEQNIKCLFVEQ